MAIKIQHWFVKKMNFKKNLWMYLGQDQKQEPQVLTSKHLESQKSDRSRNNNSAKSQIKSAWNLQNSGS